MNKTMSRKELVEKSIALFKARTEDVLHATSDGQFFIAKNRANVHAKAQKTELKVYDINRTEVEEELKEPIKDSGSKDESLTVKQIEVIIAETEDLEVLANLLEEEKSGKDRTTAKKAIEERITELEPNKD